MIVDKDHPLYDTLLYRFQAARISPSAEPPKEIEYQGLNWRRVEDNDVLKFVATGNVSDFQAKYSGTSFQPAQQAPLQPPAKPSKSCPKVNKEEPPPPTDDTLINQTEPPQE